MRRRACPVLGLSVNPTETAERDSLAAQLADAKTTLGKLKRAETGAQDSYASALAEGDQLKAVAIEAALTRFAAEHRQAMAVVDDLEATLEEMAHVSVPTDHLLDFWCELSASIRGRLDEAHTVAQVNEALREVLYSVTLGTHPDGRVRLQAVFGERDEWVTEDGDLSEGAPPLYPNTAVAIGGGGRSQIPTCPVEIGRNPQALRLVSVGRVLQLPPLELRL